jgi:hypothetical protein
MTEYRIVELHRKFWIEEQFLNKSWTPVSYTHVPRFFDSLADARSWVATIKKGVVYHDAEAPPLSESNLQWECARDFRIFSDRLSHDAEDAPNLAQYERKAEDDTSDGIKPLWWFYERLGTSIRQDHALYLKDKGHCSDCHERQERFGYKYSDPR